MATLQRGLSNALGPLQSVGRAQNFGAGIEDRVAGAVLRVLRRERMLDRDFSVYEDDCIVHCREGDEDLFRDNKDLFDFLKGYVIIPVEEYVGLGGK